MNFQSLFYHFTFKLVVWGYEGGKTTLINSFLEQTYSPSFERTLGCGFYLKNIVHNDMTITLHIVCFLSTSVLNRNNCHHKN